MKSAVAITRDHEMPKRRAKAPRKPRLKRPAQTTAQALRPARPRNAARAPTETGTASRSGFIARAWATAFSCG